ncbi:MAG: restriction endonuclease subunit S [Pseudonocardiaceae bacterium]
MAIPWLSEYTGQTTSVKYSFQILLGKMVQPSATSEGDTAVQYLNAASVQWHGIEADPGRTMWASPAEIRDLSIRPGDLLICEGGDVGRSAIYSGPSGLIFQNSVHRARGYQGSDIRYLKYLLMSLHGSGWFDVLCNKATIAHLTVEKLGTIEIPQTPLDEQRRIADFLDAETARIDFLSASQLRMADVLDERRVALTSHLVFGHDRDGDKRDSTIPAAGPIPSTWQVLRTKTFMREIMDLSENGDEELLSVSHLTGVTPRSEKNVNMFLAESMVGYKRRRPGDLAINTLWAWMGALGVSRYSGILSPAYGIYRMTSGAVDGRYLDLLVRTPEYVAEMTRFSKGVWTSRLRLYPESFLSLSVPVPPLKEQRNIIEQIATETSEQLQLKSRLESFANTLAERRQALITAAVTGQMDVTTAHGVTAGGITP